MNKINKDHKPCYPNEEGRSERCLYTEVTTHQNQFTPGYFCVLEICSTCGEYRYRSAPGVEK